MSALTLHTAAEVRNTPKYVDLHIECTSKCVQCKDIVQIHCRIDRLSRVFWHILPEFRRISHLCSAVDHCIVYVCVCMCVICTHIHTNIYIYIYIYILHAFIRTHTHFYMYESLCACTCHMCIM